MTDASRLRDVADAAGVSLRTASRVLNHDPRVATSTRACVEAAMTQLRFQPNPLARSLRAGSDTTTVGLIVESLADPFFAALADSVEAAMSEHGRSVLVASTRRDPSVERTMITRMLQRRVAGLLLCPTGEDHAWLAEQDAPVVLLDRNAPGFPADLVAIDDRRAAFDAVSHLVDHGHLRIAYVGDTAAIPTSAARLAGYRDALTAHGLIVDQALIREDGSTGQAAATVVSELLSSHHPPTAIFSATTRGSLGVIPALHAHHRTNIAVVGFGDFAMADTIVPAITVVDHSASQLGSVAVDRLLARLSDGDMAVERILVPVHLVQRGSGEIRPCL